MTAPATNYDLVVAGAGCAGMATALFAAIAGLRVLLLERSPWVGGTTALAAGALWIPNTVLAQGSGDTPARAAQYLEAASDGRGDPALRARLLALGPEAVDCLLAHSAVQLRAFAWHPDYLSDLPGASTHGRVLECLPFDGRLLGDDFQLVRPPIPEFTVLGGMMVDRIDIGHLLRMGRSRASFAHAARLLLRHAHDRLRHPRGTRLVLGNALAGRLLLSLRRQGVTLWTEALAQRLLQRDGRIHGVEVQHQGRPLRVPARLGVVLAGGGFGDHTALRSQLIPPQVRHSPRAGLAGGELFSQALALGAQQGLVHGSAAHWAPVSTRTHRDGSTAVFPHFVLDRAKPGTLVVDATGRRCLDESTSYHRFGEALLAPDAHGQRRGAAWLVADHRAVLRYGLGMVRPGGHGLRQAVRDGYLRRASDLAGLALSLAIPPAVLEATVARFNDFAASGVDADFGRGGSVYARNLGDATVQPNPTLGPLAQPPFYALRLEVGDIAASAGLATDGDARVLDAQGRPLPGLYAVGDDMQSVMGGAYPGPGIHLGPAVCFAYAAARAARVDAETHPPLATPATSDRPAAPAARLDTARSP